MSEIKLQVGKTYRSRAGEEVKIVGTNDSIWPFIGDNGEVYNEEGRYFSANWDYARDLIEEVTISDANQKHNEMKTLKLEVGKTYRNRKGEEVKIVGNDNTPWYPCRGSNDKWYTESGSFDYCGKKHLTTLSKKFPANPLATPSTSLTA